MSLDQKSKILCSLLLLYVQIEFYQNLLLPHKMFFFFKKKGLELVHLLLFLHDVSTTWKVSKCGVFYGLYFPVFGLNADIYTINHSIRSECRKIRTRKNSVFGHISRIVQKYHCPRCTLLTKFSCLINPFLVQCSHLIPPEIENMKLICAIVYQFIQYVYCEKNIRKTTWKYKYSIEGKWIPSNYDLL